MATKTNTNIRGYKYYRLTKTVGHKNGKPVRKQFLGRSKAEAEKKYADWIREEERMKTADGRQGNIWPV